MNERGINHLPVLSRCRLAGIVSSRDLEPRASSAKHALDKAILAHPDRVEVASVMTADVHTAKPSDTLSSGAELIFCTHVGAIPVVEQAAWLALSRAAISSQMKRIEAVIAPWTLEAFREAAPRLGITDFDLVEVYHSAPAHRRCLRHASCSAHPRVRSAPR